MSVTWDLIWRIKHNWWLFHFAAPTLKYQITRFYLDCMGAGAMSADHRRGTCGGLRNEDNGLGRVLRQIDHHCVDCDPAMARRAEELRQIALDPRLARQDLFPDLDFERGQGR